MCTSLQRPDRTYMLSSSDRLGHCLWYKHHLCQQALWAGPVQLLRGKAITYSRAGKLWNVWRNIWAITFTWDNLTFHHIPYAHPYHSYHILSPSPHIYADVLIRFCYRPIWIKGAVHDLLRCHFPTKWNSFSSKTFQMKIWISFFMFQYLLFYKDMFYFLNIFANIW